MAGQAQVGVEVTMEMTIWNWPEPVPSDGRSTLEAHRVIRSKEPANKPQNIPLAV